jgi:hypothetical protein
VGAAFARAESMKHSARGILGLIWAELTEFVFLPKADICENRSLLFLPKAVIFCEFYSFLCLF